MTITFQEKRLLDLYRAADERAKTDVLWILEEHPEEKGKTGNASPKNSEKTKRGFIYGY